MIGERSAAPEIICDTTEVYSGESFIFTIMNTSGADEVAYRYTNSTSGYLTGTINVLSDVTIWETTNRSPNTWNYSFCVLRNGCWSAWSNPVTIIVTARPALPQVTLSLPDSIAQGQNLSVTFEAVEGATQYYLYVYDSRDRQISYRYLSAPDTVIIQGCQLPLGTIRIELSAYSNIGGESRATAVTTVIAGERPIAPIVTPPENLTIQQGTRFTFSVTCENAERYSVRYYRIGNTNDVSYNYFNPSEGESTEWSTIIYNSGNTYAYSFSAYINGTWSEWSEFTEITTE